MSLLQNFDEFTNLYSLPKTLKFELQPVGNTEQMLIKNGIIAMDKARKESYIKTRPFMDKLHREFIRESLLEIKLEGLEEYLKLYVQFQKDKKDNVLKVKLKKTKEKLRKDLVKHFDACAKKWTDKYSHLNSKKKDVGLLFEEAIFDLLKERYGQEEDAFIENEKRQKELVFDRWKGFIGYFDKFFETRKNFYKSDGKAGSLATRIVDQNLDRFLNNLIIFESFKDKLDLHEVEEFFKLKAIDIFKVDFYNFCLLQDGIDIYNDFIGGRTLENGVKKKGINEIINKYRQDNPKDKMPFLKKLDKQILSEKEKLVFDEIDSKEKLIGDLRGFVKTTDEKFKIFRKLLNEFFRNNNKFKLSGIYITNKVFNSYSSRWLDENSSEYFNTNLENAAKKDKYKLGEFIPLSYIQQAFDLFPSDSKPWKEVYYREQVISHQKTLWGQFLEILEYEFNLQFEKINIVDGKEVKAGYEVYREELENLLTSFKVDKDSKVIIKNFCDSALHIYQMAMYFALAKKREWVGDTYELDSEFYNHLEYGFKDKFYNDSYEKIVIMYNKLRNYITKKPYSEEKWKLNFENPTLADGWDKNKERDNSAVILIKKDKYYLAIMKKGDSDIFLNKYISENKSTNEQYKKLVYKLFPDPSKMMPKVCFSKKGLEFFNPPKDIIQIYKNSEFKKGETFSISSMQKLIAFYIKALSLYPGWKDYNFTKVKSPAKYIENIGEFFNDVAYSGYKIWFEHISEEYIDSQNKKGKLFLFEIFNKDLSEKSSGIKSLHTMYFQNLFSLNNVNSNFIYKLNGQAELFFRPKSLDKVIEKRTSNRNVVVKKRYTVNKIFFHLPITLNRISNGVVSINSEINNLLAENPDINIIGLDRGEKHLIYYSVRTQRGEVLETGSLNTINNVPYLEKLKEKADKREQARRDWQEVENIKDLKKGYISHVVRKIADLAIKHNAIIVMEDLNMRFKQVRGGIEASVYQQLEKALIEKLNFLVDKKELDPAKPGHLLKAYQLTDQFTSFKDMGKQTGIIFYTQAAYTSQIDPLTGWRPNLKLKYVNSENAKIDVLKFNTILYNKKEDRFEFEYDLKKFIKFKEYPAKTVWTVCSNVERFRWQRKPKSRGGEYIHYKNLTDNFKILFEKYNIDITKNILQQIEQVESKNNESLFKDLVFYFNLICQIRNTQQDKGGDENDFILSPVTPFFDSRNAGEYGEGLPKNGDENGAFNIARKGQLILEKIRVFYKVKGSVSKLSWNDIFISNLEWDNFVSKN